jgi:hypothetical protein
VVDPVATKRAAFEGKLRGEIEERCLRGVDALVRAEWG